MNPSALCESVSTATISLYACAAQTHTHNGTRAVVGTRRQLEVVATQRNCFLFLSNNFAESVNICSRSHRARDVGVASRAHRTHVFREDDAILCDHLIHRNIFEVIFFKERHF